MGNRAKNPANRVERAGAELAPRLLRSLLPLPRDSEQIFGTVTDALGRPLAQVSLQLRDRDGQIIARVATDEGGRFKIAPPKPGLYSLVAAKPGFKSANKIAILPRNTAETISLSLEAKPR